MSNLAYLRIAENIDNGIQTAPKTDGELSKAFIEFLKSFTPRKKQLWCNISACTN